MKIRLSPDFQSPHVIFTRLQPPSIMRVPMVSVIVPVFNIERYLGRCIESILAQTFSDFELILVDDGSRDSSGKICNNYAHIDDRIHVVHKHNGGVSSARNLGIENATGEYITFVDADDWVNENYIQYMMFQNSDADMSMQGYQIMQPNGTCITHKFDSSYCSSDIASAFCEAEYRNIINSPISKLFKSEIIKDNNILFNHTISYGEDHIFVLEYLKYVKRIKICDASEYNYFQDDSLSLTRKSIPSQLLITYMLLAYKRQHALISQFNRTDYNRCVHAIAWRFYGVYIKLLADFFHSNPSLSEYNNIIHSLKSYHMNKKNLNYKRKCIFSLLENTHSSLSYFILKHIF